MSEVFFTRPGHEDLLDLEEEFRERVEAKLRDLRSFPERFLDPFAGVRSRRAACR